MASLEPDEFIGDGGPAFDPKEAPEAPELEFDDEELAAAAAELGWDEQQIRDLLLTQGNACNWLLRVTPEDDTWKHTEDDLRAISSPLTRILNRYDASRAAAAAGDEIALSVALFNYGARNVMQRRRLIAALQAQAPEPVTGVPAPEGTGPEDDPEWQRLQGPPALTPKGPAAR